MLAAYEPASANGHNGNGHSADAPTTAHGLPVADASQPSDAPGVYGVVNRGDGRGLA
jgi:hypothetical protein